MASPPEMSNRNDMTLWASDVMLDDLLARAGDWTIRSEAERLDFGSPAGNGISRGPRWWCRQVAASSRGADAAGEQVELGPPVTLALDELQAVDLAFHLAVRPWGGQRGIHRRAVGADAVRQRDERRQAAGLGAVEPGIQGARVPRRDELTEPLEELIAGRQRGIIGQELLEGPTLMVGKLIGRSQAEPAQAELVAPGAQSP